MAKIGGAYTAPKLKKPIPTDPPLTEYDPKYLERKAEVGERKFALKSGRWFMYFTEGSPEDPAVLCLHGARNCEHHLDLVVCANHTQRETQCILIVSVSYWLHDYMIVP